MPDPSVQDPTEAAPPPDHPGRRVGPNVILEDLDKIEAQRQRIQKGRVAPEQKGTIRDPLIWRKLLTFARPHVPFMLVAMGMSLASAVATMGSFFVLKGVLEPMFKAGRALSRVDAGLSVVGRFVTTDLADSSFPGFLRLRTALGELFHFLWFTRDPLDQLHSAAVMLVTLVVLAQANKYGQKLLMRAVALNLVRIVRIALFDKIMSLSMRFFHANHSGKLLSRITNDLTKLGNLLVDVMVHWFTDAFTVIGSLWYVWAEGGSVVFVGLIIAGVSFAPVQQLGRRIRSREAKNQKKMANIFHALAESLGAQKIVKAFGAQAYERERFKAVNDTFTQGRLQSTRLSARTEPLVEIMGAVGVAALLYVGGRKVLEGSWEGAAFFTVVLALFTSISALRRLGDTSTKLQGGLSSADRVATLLFSDPEIVDRLDATQLPAFHQSIRFDHVNYCHEAERPVLRDISFELHRGQTVALVGHTGSGKSTIGDLVMRFYDVDDGTVCVDGHDVRDLKLESLRDQIAMVTQETVLFEGTIGTNIAYAMKDVSDEDIQRVAHAAHAHDFILRQTKGYDTRVGERGATLSGGERQRIAIARALLRDKPILILDEATSALDTRSEQIVQQAINHLIEGRTTLIIAHRLSTIRNADQILVLEDGRIVERGHHEELMAMNGVYAGMVQIQGSQS